MPLEILTGNIFTSQCQTLVNTVNCVGVMGAGIALECRLRYPAMYEKYVSMCQKRQLDIGLLWLYKSEQRWVLNFPTKKDWKHPSKEGYLRRGLTKFVETYADKGITSIAFPLLGADKGGIPKETSRAILREYLEGLDISVEIYQYDPLAQDEVFDTFRDWLLSTGSDQACALSGIRRPQMHALMDGVSNPAICQVNQLLSVKGIGLGTVEKVFHLAMNKDESSNHPGSIPLFE
ncbi:Appr-1-p processing protein [Mangrovimicrobium sediminis]|uniref:Appr-1-p processing protein n=1 Tax=Mangrovimicrobium sediminis TaxID=2562682 RepID=A0A4Z0LYJ8_9GAMM|nr:macro domain-containing protein [Haliea sp. SAOS-164]TGD72208.1 Appr-1-p processing protein [Haliea sp. SAOS-164]